MRETGPPPPDDEPEPLAADALMRRLFDLWQHQWGAVAADPTMAEEWAQAMVRFSQFGQPPMAGPPTGAASSAFGPATAGFQNTPLGAMMAAASAYTPPYQAHGFPSSPPRPQAPTPSSDNRADGVGELLARLDALERRVGGLEQGGKSDAGSGVDPRVDQPAEPNGDPSDP